MFIFRVTFRHFEDDSAIPSSQDEEMDHEDDIKEIHIKKHGDMNVEHYRWLEVGLKEGVEFVIAPK